MQVSRKLVRPHICNPVIPDAGRAGSGLHFSAVKSFSQAGETDFSLKEQGEKKAHLMQALHRTQQLMGQLGTSDFMALPRNCHKQKKMVGMFLVIGLLFPTAPTFACYFLLSKSKAPPSPCHIPLVVGFRTLIGRVCCCRSSFG